MPLDYDIIGNRIRDARKRTKITQEQLADLTGFTESHISHIENGKTKLSLPAIVTIANALHVTVDELLFGNLAKNEAVLQKEMAEILKDCSDAEFKIILEVVRSMQASFQKFLK